MVAFIDESGDSGFKINNGSSRFFTIALVVFEDNGEALACDQRIDLLRKELAWKPESEFHFKSNSDRVRELFLKTVASYNFLYYGFVLNKDTNKIYGNGFKDAHSFYKYTCGLVFENAKSKLLGATVIIDESGSLNFKRQLVKYLKTKTNTGEQRCITKVKMQRSSSNNLLQLADYVAGAINRSLIEKRKQKHYLSIIAHREARVQNGL